MEKAVAKKDGEARVRNIEYPLTGSISIEGQKTISWRLEPNKWTKLPAEVIYALKQKFANPREYDVPAAVPDAYGNYTTPPGSTRSESHLQYLIEFRD